MNKFVKLPLFLGSVCLVFCATLSVVVNICQPVIDYNNRMKQLDGYTKLYDGVNKDLINDTIEIGEAYDRINTIALVPYTGGESYVYTLTTKDPMSGSLQFMLGLDKETGVIDAYYLLNNNNAGYATYFENNENVLKDLEDNKVTASKQTLTAGVVQGAIDQALSHYDANLKGGK